MDTLEKKFTLCCSGKIISLEEPKIMGIVNATPDSFYSQSRCNSEKEIIEKTQKHLSEGATFIDLGAFSTRPGCENIPQEEEIRRLDFALKIITDNFPQAIISVDTFRSKVAEFCLDKYGVAIINDISGGMLDEKIFETVGKYHAAYILMHMKGNPQNMQQFCDYQDIIAEVTDFFIRQSKKAEAMGINDIILDPGFGFAKNLDQNYLLMSQMDSFKILQKPILVGISRKSMLFKLLNITPEEALEATTALNTIALNKGANILRVHEVKPAYQAVKICSKANFLG